MIAAEEATAFWASTGYGVLLGAGVAFVAQALMLGVQVFRDWRARTRAIVYDALAWEAGALLKLLEAMAAFVVVVEELVEETDRIVLATPLAPGELRDFPDPIYAVKSRVRTHLLLVRVAGVQVPHAETREATAPAVSVVLRAVFGDDALEGVRLSADTRREYLTGIADALAVFDHAFMGVARRHRAVRDELLAIGQK